MLIIRHEQMRTLHEAAIERFVKRAEDRVRSLLAGNSRTPGNTALRAAIERCRRRAPLFAFTTAEEVAHYAAFLLEFGNGIPGCATEREAEQILAAEGEPTAARLAALDVHAAVLRRQGVGR